MQPQQLVGQRVDEVRSLGEGEVKTYPDIAYHNFREQGLSLQVQAGRIVAVDIYNGLPATRTQPAWGRFPHLPLEVDALTLAPETTGLQIVQALGEPARKGGGTTTFLGPGTWLEYRSPSVTFELASSNFDKPNTPWSTATFT